MSSVIVYLRDVGAANPSDGEWDECWVPCAKGDRGARAFAPLTSELSPSLGEPEQRRLLDGLPKIRDFFNAKLHADFPNSVSYEATLIDEAISVIEATPWKLTAEQSEAFAKALTR